MAAVGTLMGTMAQNFIQWNCRGLKSNYEEISLLINDNNPVANCLQETFLKDSDTCSFRYHSIYNKIFKEGDKAQGGVTVIVNNNIPHIQIPVNSTLQAVVVRLSLKKNHHPYFYIRSTKFSHK